MELTQVRDRLGVEFSDQELHELRALLLEVTGLRASHVQQSPNWVYQLEAAVSAKLIDNVRKDW